MKKINLLLFCTLLYHSINAEEQNIPKIFQDIRNGDKAAIQQQLDNDENFTIKDDNGNTVLHIAAQAGEKEILRMIIEYYNNCSYFKRYVTSYVSAPALPTLDDVNNNGDTPLHSAIQHDNNTTKNENRAKVVEYLLNQDPTLMHKCNNNKLSPVFIAIDKDAPWFLDIFKKHQLNLNEHKEKGETLFTYAINEKKENSVNYCIRNTQLSNVANKANKTPIILAIDTENIPLLTLFEKDLNNYIVNTSIKPIHYAIKNNKQNALKYIIGARDSEGRTPLMYAAIEQDHNVIQQLIALGVDTHITDNKQENMLHKKARNGDQQGAQIILNNNKLLLFNANQDGDTPLFTAIQNGQFNFAQFLINAGSDINNINNKGNTILHEIANKNNEALLAELLQKINPDRINHKNANGETAIFFAAVKNNVTAIRNLIKYGAKVQNITNKYGLNPLHAAATTDAIDAIKELVRQGISLTECTTELGNTAAHVAAGYGSMKIIRYLQTEKPELFEMYNKEGDSVFACAARFDKLEITKLLLQDKYHRDGTISRLINSIASNSSTHTFLTKKHNERVKKCNNGYKIYTDWEKFITINTRLKTKHPILNSFSYIPSQVEPISSADDLWNMSEEQCSKRIAQYENACQAERNQNIRFENIIHAENEKQEALERQRAAEQERIRLELIKQAAELTQQFFTPQYSQQPPQQPQQSRPIPSAPVQSAPSAPEQPASPAAPACPNPATNDKQIQPAKLRAIADRICKKEATPEEVTLFLTESKKIINENLKTEKISAERAKELIKIALHISKDIATPKEIKEFIEEMKRIIKDMEDNG